MKRFYNYCSASQLLRRSFWLPSLFLTALITFSGPTLSANAQSTPEVCRETQKVYDGLQMEKAQLVAQLAVSQKLNHYMDLLSEMDKAVKGGYAISGLAITIQNFANDIELKQLDNEFYGSLYADLKSSNEQLALQKKAYSLLKNLIDKASKIEDDEDVKNQITRIEDQMILRDKRLRDLDCEKVLAREKSSEADGNIVFGTWSGTYSNSKGQSGRATITFEKSDDGKLSGSEDGVSFDVITVKGNTVTYSYKLSGCRKVEGTMIINPDKTAGGSYTVIECNGTDKYTGKYLDYKKQ